MDNLPQQPSEEKQAPAPGAMPAGAEDIFGGMDEPAEGAGDAGAPLPAPPLSPEMPPATIPTVPPLGEAAPTTEPTVSAGVSGSTRSSERRVGRGSRMRLVIIIVVVIVAVAAAVTIYYWPGLIGLDRSSGQATNSINQVTPVETDTATPTTDTTTTSGTIDSTAPVLDSDGDGLLDTKEEELGTDPNLLDTDGDGLNDRQEIEIYMSDPTDTDSDNDGFKDGEEVRNFYNPVGDGPLLNVNSAIEEATADNATE